MAASNESQNVCHVNGSPEKYGKLSFGSLVEYPHPSCAWCACFMLLTSITLLLGFSWTTVGFKSASTWVSPSGRVAVLEESASLVFSVGLIGLGNACVDGEVRGVDPLVIGGGGGMVARLS